MKPTKKGEDRKLVSGFTLGGGLDVFARRSEGQGATGRSNYFFARSGAGRIIVRQNLFRLVRSKPNYQAGSRMVWDCWLSAVVDLVHLSRSDNERRREIDLLTTYWPCGRVLVSPRKILSPG